MNKPVLVAVEVQELLDPVAADLSITWISADEVTPGGNFLAIVPLLSRRIGTVEMDGIPKLKIVANLAVGYDNVDLGAAMERGITVTNTPDVLTESTADLTIALLLATARRLKEGFKLIESGSWHGWHPTQLLGLELNGATLGILGAGKIGQAVARRACGFGMKIVYTSRSSKPGLERGTGARRVDIAELLSSSDVISLHLPLSSETRGIIGEAEFRMMKPGALLINTARGDLVVEADLVVALSDGKLGGAGLDVFPGEPNVNRLLIEHPRVVTLPHIGSATDWTRAAMANLAMNNVVAVLAGRPPMTPVVVDGRVAST